MTVVRISPVAFAQRNGKNEFNASGVVHVGADRFVFTDNHDPTALFELTLGSDGGQAGPIVRRPLTGLQPGALSDPEGLARIDGDTLVAASSLAIRKKKVGHDGLVRIRYAPGGDLSAEAMPGFRAWVVGRFPELAAAAGRDVDQDGLNVEGIAWQPGTSTMFLGVRSPVTDSGIPVLCVHVDLSAPWTVNALTLASQPMRHITNHQPGQGIRDLTYDPDTDGFLMLLGRSVTGGDVPFQLCRWDGTSSAVRRVEVELPSTMKPEGVTVYHADGTRRLLVVGDSGSFATLPDR